MLTNVVRDLIYIIKKKQQIPENDCKSKRLLIAQMASTSFEGMGSLLKQVQFSVAVAMHSNRSVIWGIGFPFMFEHSRDVWDGEGNDQIEFNGETVNCTQKDPLAGPLGCFFEPLTTCTLGDIAPSEMLTFSNNAYNESARIMLTEVRKGVALYHPPIGLIDYIINQRGYTKTQRQQIKEREEFLWASAVSAYVFRLKPNLIQSFQEKFQRLTDGEKSVWGIHVRHGDLKALSNIYGYKDVFDFEDYFAAAIGMSHTLQQAPRKVFVSTDSFQADHMPTIYNRFLTERVGKSVLSGSAKPMDNSKAGKGSSCVAGQGGVCSTFSEYDDEDYEEEDEEEEDDHDDYDEDDDDYDEDEDDYDDDEYVLPQPKTKKDKRNWFQDQVPTVFYVGNSDRYRTEHGSHTVAANGGCQRDERYNEKGMRCALNLQAIVHYQTMDKHRNIPRSVRLMQVMFEAVQDIYFLSQCDALVTQGSSHFSTLASLLIWARTGAKHIDKNVLFLDQRRIELGFIPTAFLHGMNLLNGTQSVDESKSTGAQRWAAHTQYFISGLPNKQINKVNINYNPWSDESRMKLVRGLPHLPEKVFSTEAKLWIGRKYKPVWPGNCPGEYGNPHSAGLTPLQYITSVINEGVEHLGMSHEGQALQCWSDALHVLEAYPKADIQDHMNEYRSIANGNSATLKKMKYTEMIINEIHDTRQYLNYEDRYMKDVAEGNRGMKSLEDVNDEIAVLERKIKNLKELRDKLISANYMMLSGGIQSPTQPQP